MMLMSASHFLQTISSLSTQYWRLEPLAIIFLRSLGIQVTQRQLAQPIKQQNYCFLAYHIKSQNHRLVYPTLTKHTRTMKLKRQLNVPIIPNVLPGNVHKHFAINSQTLRSLHSQPSSKLLARVPGARAYSEPHNSLKTKHHLQIHY